MIETNRASKQTSEPNTYSLPVATGQSQGSVQTNKQNGDNKVLSEATTNLDAPTIPDKTVGKTPEGPDETTTQSKNVKPDATNTLSPDATKDNMVKTKTITIRRSKDPHTFKCSVCSTRASTLKELNTHFIKNHRECGL